MHAARIEHDEVKLRCEWSQTASLMAMFANCNRDPKKRSAPYTPNDFNPFAKQENDVPLRKIKPSQLARIIIGNESPEKVLAE